MSAILRLPLIYSDEHARRRETKIGRKSLHFCGVILLWLIALLVISTPAFAGKDDKEDTERLTTDDLFARVAQRYSGFGGMFVNEKKDTIYVFLRDGNLNAVVKELKKVFGKESLPERKAKALPAQYSFLQLREWFDLLTKQVSNIPEVTLTDIDDSKNRLTVGVENLDATSKVLERVRESGIPEGAVNIEEIARFKFQQLPPDVLDFPCAGVTSIRDDRCRPLVGGLQIAGPTIATAPAFANCTLGVTAISERVEPVEEGFITASHCSNTLGGRPPGPILNPDGSLFYQPGAAAPPAATLPSADQIGTEQNDVRFTPCPFNTAELCRQSDSTFSEIEEAADATQVATIRLGHIARPTLLNTQTDSVDESCNMSILTSAAKPVPSSAIGIL
jgi:hypothetical protein